MSNNIKETVSFNRMMLNVFLEAISYTSFTVNRNSFEDTFFDPPSYLTCASLLSAFVMIEEAGKIRLESMELDPTCSLSTSKVDECHDNEKARQENDNKSISYTISKTHTGLSKGSFISSEGKVEKCENIKDRSSSHSKRKHKIRKLKALTSQLLKANQRLSKEIRTLENRLMQSSKTVADLRALEDEKLCNLEQQNRNMTLVLVSLKEEVANLKKAEDDRLYMAQLATQRQETQPKQFNKDLNTDQKSLLRTGVDRWRASLKKQWSWEKDENRKESICSPKRRTVVAHNA